MYNVQGVLFAVALFLLILGGFEVISQGPQRKVESQYCSARGMEYEYGTMTSWCVGKGGIAMKIPEHVVAE